ESSQVLASIGLGSCVGVALVSRTRALAGLAHVMLPATPEDREHSARYADFAVPELVRELGRRGAPASDLDAALVGGPKLSSFDSGALGTGPRNGRAARGALEAEATAARAAATAGGVGRTIRVHVATGEVTCKEAGGTVEPLLAPRPKR